MVHRIALTLALATAACADRVPIEDRAELGSVVQIKDWFTSVFVVPTDAGALLFDAGFRPGALERRLDEAGFPPGSITDVFLTHGHGDHIALVERLPGARVRGLAAEQALLDEESDGTVTITDPVVDGETIAIDGTTVEVFAVPGHTAGSAVYLVDGVLVLGDSAIVDRDGRLVPVAERRSDDPDQLVDEVQALAARLAPRSSEIDWLAPAHSAPVEGFAALEAFPQLAD